MKLPYNVGTEYNKKTTQDLPDVDSTRTYVACNKFGFWESNYVLSQKNGNTEQPTVDTDGVVRTVSLPVRGATFDKITSCKNDIATHDVMSVADSSDEESTERIIEGSSWDLPVKIPCENIMEQNICVGSVNNKRTNDDLNAESQTLVTRDEYDITKGFSRDFVHDTNGIIPTGILGINRVRKICRFCLILMFSININFFYR